MNLALSLKRQWRQQAGGPGQSPSGDRSIPRGALLLLGLATAAVIGGLGWGVHVFWRAQLAQVHESYLTMRVHLLSQRLAAQEGPYIALAGDSHAELLAWDRLCGWPVVNLGMSGTGTRAYRALAGRLTFRRPAAATVLFIGTNDLAHVRRPHTSRSFRSFQAHFEGLIETLRKDSEQVVHVPLVPEQIGAAGRSYLNLDVASEYRLAAADICARKGCATASVGDLPVSFREDGVHLDIRDRRANGPLFNRIEAVVCPALKTGAAPLSTQ
jgi:GDSL-like Lipase/Acylhydrolase family